MIRSTLGAPLGGTTCGGQYGFYWLACRLMTPPNFGGGGGRYFPSMVVVALGEPGAPVVCCARAFVPSANSKEAMASLRRASRRANIINHSMIGPPREKVASMETYWGGRSDRN